MASLSSSSSSAIFAKILSLFCQSKPTLAAASCKARASWFAGWIYFIFARMFELVFFSLQKFFCSVRSSFLYISTLFYKSSFFFVRHFQKYEDGGESFCCDCINNIFESKAAFFLCKGCMINNL